MTILIDLQYLPCIAYFTYIEKSDKIIIEAEEYYIKQSYRNRCHIKTAHKIDVLSVPVRNGNSKVKIRDIKIDYSQQWLNDHWRAIISAYGRSPFFEHYVDSIQDIFYQKPRYLFDLNWKLLSLCLDLLSYEKQFEFTSDYQIEPNSDIVDLRSVVHPKKSFVKNGFYRQCTYTQVFGNNFAENLSIIDLLFCEGPNSRSIIQKSTVKRNKTI